MMGLTLVKVEMRYFMKKFLCILSILCILLFTACNSGIKKSETKIDKDLIEQVVMNVQANELDEAINKCKSMSDETRKTGAEEIVAEVATQLDLFLGTKSWILTDYSLVSEEVIDDLKQYKILLELLPTYDLNTNTVKFVNKALELGGYTEFNDMHSIFANDYINEVNQYAEKGDEYGSYSYDLAVTYYKKAIQSANSICNYCEKRSSKGMHEIYTFYKLMSNRFARAIEGYDATDSEIKEVDQAYGDFQTISNEYLSAVKEVSEIESEFPTKIY